MQKPEKGKIADYGTRETLITLQLSILNRDDEFKTIWASLVAQWLRIRLPVQGTRVQALVREDPTCRGATNPVRHNYSACTRDPASHNY